MVRNSTSNCNYDNLKNVNACLTILQPANKARYFRFKTFSLSLSVGVNIPQERKILTCRVREKRCVQPDFVLVHFECDVPILHAKIIKKSGYDYIVTGAFTLSRD